MMDLNNLSFNQPWLFLLLLLIPVYLFFYFKRAPLISHVMDWSFIPSEVKMRTIKTIIAKCIFVFPLLFFIFSIIALARPQIRLVEEKIKANGIDIFLAMDLSSSMLSKDFNPDRLSVSKQVAINFISKRPYDRVGLVSFAGEAYTQSPLTTDHELVKQQLSELRCGYLDDGTAIGMGMATAINRLKDSKVKTRVIILLTDGKNNQGYISPNQAAEIAKELGIRIYAIGVGTEGLALSPVGRTQNGEYTFARARVNIDDNLLNNIATMTGGAYYRATTEEALEQIYSKIDELEKTEIEVNIIQRVQEYYFPFLGFAFGSLFLYFIVKYVWLKIWPE